ncbi:ABC transporter permease [Priestia koreensis]|uniref:ABC transporter n=1 Tax=Priestia koreensis TaxID=284581 RepID=A0A0M0KXJ7_9BACI|nr:ABC transporter permease [Priestia koreensis]KOO43534.1 ABC transporter [Priestia koreensis]
MMSVRRMNAILIKDWKDLLKNSYILFTLAMPLVIAAWLGSKDYVNVYSAIIIVNLALVITACFVQAAMVAEEKEKSTLRGLLLSPASTIEILIGKSALSAILTILIITGSVLLGRISIPAVGMSILNMILCLIIYVLSGTLLGLLSRTVMETSIIGMPIMFLFGMGSIIKSVIDNETIKTFISYLPNDQFEQIWLALDKGKSFSDVGSHFLILVAWAIGVLVLTILVYRKRQFD